MLIVSARLQYSGCLAASVAAACQSLRKKSRSYLPSPSCRCLLQWELSWRLDLVRSPCIGISRRFERDALVMPDPEVMLGDGLIYGTISAAPKQAFDAASSCSAFLPASRSVCLSPYGPSVRASVRLFQRSRLSRASVSVMVSARLCSSASPSMLRSLRRFCRT